MKAWKIVGKSFTTARLDDNMTTETAMHSWFLCVRCVPDFYVSDVDVRFPVFLLSVFAHRRTLFLGSCVFGQVICVTTSKPINHNSFHLLFVAISVNNNYLVEQCFPYFRNRSIGHRVEFFENDRLKFIHVRVGKREGEL